MIYLAGSSRDKDYVSELSLALALEGFSTLHAWTKLEAGKIHAAQDIWNMCLIQVNKADVVVVVVPFFRTVI